ncbi:MAG: plasmid pRiA4b ORF-3 family protein [Deltaproteobacteria bacterium]|nr:plasmid pRiA4b ORF-3 family protein [Deltaproteobacteria bacterium]
MTTYKAIGSSGGAQKVTDLRKVYQLRISLSGVRPEVWRRVLVTSDTTLEKLHRVFQAVMGWEDFHLHYFRIGPVLYQPQAMMEETDLMPPALPAGTSIASEKGVRLSRALVAGARRFTYVYDFGDNWEHKIDVEKILPLDPHVHYPVCVEGERACPPEDVGGPDGYRDFLEALRTPSHPDHQAILEWVRPTFEPDRFDWAKVNTRLSRVR